MVRLGPELRSDSLQSQDFSHQGCDPWSSLYLLSTRAGLRRAEGVNIYSPTRTFGHARVSPAPSHQPHRHTLTPPAGNLGAEDPQKPSPLPAQELNLLGVCVGGAGTNAGDSRRGEATGLSCQPPQLRSTCAPADTVPAGLRGRLYKRDQRRPLVGLRRYCQRSVNSRAHPALLKRRKTRHYLIHGSPMIFFLHIYIYCCC